MATIQFGKVKVGESFTVRGEVYRKTGPMTAISPGNEILGEYQFVQSIQVGMADAPGIKSSLSVEQRAEVEALIAAAQKKPTKKKK